MKQSISVCRKTCLSQESEIPKIEKSSTRKTRPRWTGSTQHRPILTRSHQSMHSYRAAEYIMYAKKQHRRRCSMSALPQTEP